MSNTVTIETPTLAATQVAQGLHVTDKAVKHIRLAMAKEGISPTVFVDPKSFVYLHGMTLDYEETLMRQGFNFINPNSTRSCGCGSSFS